MIHKFLNDSNCSIENTSSETLSKLECGPLSSSSGASSISTHPTPYPSSSSSRSSPTLTSLPFQMPILSQSLKTNVASSPFSNAPLILNSSATPSSIDPLAPYSRPSTSTDTLEKTKERRSSQKRKNSQELAEIHPLVLNYFNSFLIWSNESSNILISNVNFFVSYELFSKFSSFLKFNEETKEMKWEDCSGNTMASFLGTMEIIQIDELQQSFFELSQDNDLTKEAILSFKKKYLNRLALLGPRNGKGFLANGFFERILEDPHHASRLKEQALSILHLAGLVVLRNKQCLAIQIWLMHSYPGILSQVESEWVGTYYSKHLSIAFMYSSYIENGIVEVSSGKTLPDDFWSNCRLFSMWLQANKKITFLWKGVSSIPQTNRKS